MICEHIVNDDLVNVAKLTKQHREYRFAICYCKPDVILRYSQLVKNHKDIVNALVNTKHKEADICRYRYCRYVCDDPRVWKALATSKRLALWEWLCYCVNVNLRPEMIHRIANSNHHRSASYLYTIAKSNDSDIVWKALAQCNVLDAAFWQYMYCREVKDREEMWRAITRSTSIESAKAQYLYCRHVKDREEMWRALANNPARNSDYWRDQYRKHVRPEMYQ